MLQFDLTPANLLWKSVLPLSHISDTAVIRYSPSYFCVQSSDTYPYLIVLVHVDLSRFAHYHVPTGGTRRHWSAPINLNSLGPPDELINNNDTLLYRTNYSLRSINLIYEDPNQIQDPRVSEIALVHPPNNLRELNELNSFEYQAVVGIPSANLRQILLDPNLHGEDVLVVVTNWAVAFYINDEPLIYSAEDEECIIGGLAEDDEVSLSLNLYFKDSVIEALQHSSTVWLLLSRTSPTMLNCPVWPFANIKYHFVQ